MPSTVRASFALYIAHGVLSLIDAALGIVLLPQTIALTQQAAARGLQGRDTRGVDVNGIATASAVGGTAAGAAIGIALGVLTIVFAFRLRSGRNWARIVLLVFTVVALPGLIALVGPGSIGPGLLSSVSSLAAVAAAVLSFLTASNPWFRRTTLPPTAA